MDCIKSLTLQHLLVLDEHLGTVENHIHRVVDSTANPDTVHACSKIGEEKLNYTTSVSTEALLKPTNGSMRQKQAHKRNSILSILEKMMVNQFNIWLWKVTVKQMSS